MFFGLFEHSLDDKNRVVLPLGLRKGLSDETLSKGFVLAAGMRNQYLVLLPTGEWEAYQKALEAKYDTDEQEVDDYLTDLFSSAVFADLDKQYRFTIPDSSRKVAGIGRDVCFVGRGRKVYIYARERWEERQRTRTDFMAPPPRREGGERR